MLRVATVQVVAVPQLAKFSFELPSLTWFHRIPQKWMGKKTADPRKNRPARP
jgi:hypothetical protein